MGLNLPIKTLLFTTDTKFDGISNRPLTPNEIIQISGRAGRYTHHESGFIGATSKKVLKHIQKEFNAHCIPSSHHFQ
jgi:ATP-dependent RNA helicase SUPV3L1/SUV3